MEYVMLVMTIVQMLLRAGATWQQIAGRLWGGLTPEEKAATRAELARSEQNVDDAIAEAEAAAGGN